MDTGLFVEKLKLLAPSKENLRKVKFSDKLIATFISRYICVPKSAPTLRVISSDVIINLFQNYDCSKVAVGIVDFLKDVKEEIGFYQIGNLEQDLLVINRNTLQIEVLDFFDTDHVIWYCASNSEKFLEAMLECAEFLTFRMVNSPLKNEDEITYKKVLLCINIAGGDIYMDFYKMLLGYFH